MSEDIDQPGSLHHSAALKRLMDHLTALDTLGGTDLPMESDMLSLLVSGTLRGDDIQKQYPILYRKLLENGELRQAFLDALESVEAERMGQQTPMPGASRHTLPFLTQQPSQPALEVDLENNWRAILQRSMEHLQSIFSPQQLAYRADPELMEDPWFTLVREELNSPGNSLSVVLECTPSTELPEALAAYINVAVTVESSSEIKFPLRASLEWGQYKESISIVEEGRARFPDIPMSAILDSEYRHLQSGFRLVLEAVV